MGGAARVGPVFAVALLVVPALGGCFGPSDFTARIQNNTDRGLTVMVVLVDDANGTEAYNRTYDVAARNQMKMDGLPPWSGNFTVRVQLDDGRTSTYGLFGEWHFCGSCIWNIRIEEDAIHHDTGVIE